MGNGQALISCGGRCRSRPTLPVPYEVACANLTQSIHKLDFRSRELTDSERAAQLNNYMVAASCVPRHACVSSRNGDVTKPPVAAVVVEDVLFIAWRGSSTIMDWMQDASGDAVQCPLWSMLWPNIWCHNGIMGHILHDFSQFLGAIEDLIHKYDVREIVFTGTSLGGGIATMTLLGALGQLTLAQRGMATLQMNLDSAACMQRLANLCPELELRTIAFAAPMVFRLPLASTDMQADELRIIQHLFRHSTNYVFGQDIVPRLPGHTEFVLAAFNECGPEIAKASLGHVAWRYAHKHARNVCNKLMEEDHRLQLVPTLSVLKQYRQTSKIVLMDSVRKPSQILAPEEFARIPFDKRRLKSGYKCNAGEILRLLHNQTPSRVLFLDNVKERATLNRRVVRIINSQYKEHIYAPSRKLAADKKYTKRMVLTWRPSSSPDEKDDLVTRNRFWQFERVEGKQYFFIKSIEYNEYLYPSSYHMVDDGDKRVRMVLMYMRNRRGESEYDPTNTAHWWDVEYVTGTEFVRIRNVKYNEYLCAPSEKALADVGISWAFAKTYGQRRIVGTDCHAHADLEDQAKWWRLDTIRDFEPRIASPSAIIA